MSKVSSNYTIDEKVVNEVTKMAETELNGNKISKSLMVEVLLKEAIATRKKKK